MAARGVLLALLAWGAFAGSAAASTGDCGCAPPIHVVKTGPAFAYSGDTLTFGFAVTNPGNEPLQNITVVDDRCGPAQLVSKKDSTNSNDPTPNTLDPGDTWTYTCSYVITHKLGDPNPVTNTVTASGTTVYTEKPVTDTDTHDTLILHPAVGIAKAGPATATAGSAITYTLTVTNPGDVSFAAAKVAVADALCSAPPALQSTNGDGSPGTLDPGDHWTYTCQVPTQAGQTQVDNVAKVTGTDEHGRQVTASAEAKTALTQPAAPAQPAAAAPTPQQGVSPVSAVSPGRARLRGPRGCPTTGVVSASVTGSRIVRVTWYVDGRKVATLTKADSHGRWMRSLRVTSLRYGAHVVIARVQFSAQSGTRTKTLRVLVRRCRPAVAKPNFTG